MLITAKDIELCVASMINLVNQGKTIKMKTQFRRLQKNVPGVL